LVDLLDGKKRVKEPWRARETFVDLLYGLGTLGEQRREHGLPRLA